MPEVKLPDASITFDSILYAVALIVVLAGVLVALVKGWEAWKKISVRDRVKALEGRMDKVEARLSLGDKRFELQAEDMGQMLNTQQALLIHFISGNDHDRLRDELTNLSEYMSRRATRAMEYAAEHQQQAERNEGNGS
jgi:uncharacterized membrane protein affecting hemolysin expression